MGIESGTCNVCSSPCKSCMHNNRTVFDMESKEECGSSCNTPLAKEDVSYSSTYSNKMPCYKKRSLDDLPFTGIEANKLLSSSSGHDSYFKNADSKASVKARATCEKVEDVDMSTVSLNETKLNQPLEKTSAAADFSRRIHLKQDEEVISCLTENKDFNVEVGHYSIGLDNKDTICSSVPNADNKNVVKVEATNCFPGSDIEDNQSNCRRYIAHPEDSVKECEDSVSSPFHAKPNLLLTHNGYDDFHKNDCKSSDNGLNCQVNDDGKSSLKTQVVERKYRERKTSAGPCLTDENRLDKDVSFEATMVSAMVNTEFEMPCLLDESNIKESQQVIGGGSGTEQELTDVNVCDICGDVGREYLLAICSNCGDGAEHIYCMRKMLRKVPEGDWLCETCQLKEQTEKKIIDNHKETTSTPGKCKLNVGPEITKMDDSEKVLEKPKECTLKKFPDTMKRDMCEKVPETSKLIKQKVSSTSHLRSITKFDTKPKDPDRKKQICNLQSSNFSAKRRAEYQEVLSPNSRPPDVSGRFVEKGSPRKKPCLSREVSSKNLDARKEGTACVSLSNVDQNTNKIPAISRSQSTLGSHLSKAPSPLQSPHRLFSRSSSFNINSTSKVKPYAEDVPFKRAASGSSISEQRKNALLRSKSTSFKSIENKTKRYVDPSYVLLHKKKENMENKCNPATSHLPSSPKTSAGIHISKKNMDTTMSTVKSKHHLYDPKRQRLDKGSSDANDIRNKTSMKHSDDQRLSHSPRARSCAIPIMESVQSNSIIKIAESATCTEIPKAASLFDTPQIAVGDTSQSCSTDKLKSSSLEPCSENNSIDDGIKRNKWKDAAKKTILKAKPQNTSYNDGLDNRLAELHPASNVVSHMVEISNDTSQFCSTDKLKSSSLEPCFENNSMDDGIKKNKWKDAAKKTILKAKPQNTSYNDGLDNRLAELPPASNAVSHMVEISNDTSQSCSTDKLKSSSLEPCSENNSMDDGIKRNKWKDAAKKTILKAKPQNTSYNDELDNRLAELPPASNVVSHMVEISNDTSQSCSTDKLKSFSVEPCSENNSMDDGLKKNRWKDAAKKTILKAKPQNTSYIDGLDNRLVKLPPASNVVSHMVEISNDTSQSCSTDKLISSSLEPCSENNSMDDGIKRNKWKDAAKKTILKAKPQNTSYNDGLDNRLAEFPPASNVSHVVEISNEHNISTVLEDSPSTEVACTFKDIRCPETIDLNAIASASDDMTTQTPQHADSHMTLAIPNFEYIWQGCFEVLSEVESAPYYGIQAHLSTSVSPKVHEMTTKFPTEIMLEEVPWASSWPMQFQGISPDENNIALFFFAKDIESYEKSYSKLLEKMLKNDLSLKGIIDGVELLIFPSTKLPIQSQRWNRLFFLWGVFKARRHNNNNFIPKSVSQKEPLRTNSNFDPKAEDLPLTPKIEVSNCKLPSGSASSTCTDNVDTSTPKVEEFSFTHKSQASDQNPSILSSPYNKPLNDQKSSFLSSSDNLRLDCSNHANYFSGNNSHFSNKTFSLPESRFQMTNTPPCSELEKDSSYLNFFDSNMRGKSVITSAHLSSSNVQIWHSRESHPHPTSPGSDNIRNIPKDKEEFRSNTSYACSYTSNAVIQSNYLPLPSPTGSEIPNLRSSSSSSNVHPLFSATVNAEGDRTFKVADKDILFFPDAKRTVPNTQPDNVVEILSSDEDDAANPNKPNLELVLWNKRNSELEEKWKVTDADDEESASLSLSLAIPASKKEQVKKGENLQENVNANPPLRLFGKSIGI